MPYDSSIVGTTVGPFECDVDAGWTMAYAAGIGDPIPRYIDSLMPGGLLAHPLFPVCCVGKAMREIDTHLKDLLGNDEAIRRVHATQDMFLHRAIRPPEKLTTHATVLGVEWRKLGAYVVVRHDMADAAGAPVSTIYSGAIYRGVGVAGPDRPPSAMLQPLSVGAWDGHPRAEFSVAIPAGFAHVYAACTRRAETIDIHTDTAIAKRAGLPAPILMGTATLALSVSKIIMAEAGSDPERVARVCGRFAAMVLMPSEVMVRIMKRCGSTAGDTVFFETINAEGGRAIRDGVVILRK